MKESQARQASQQPRPEIITPVTLSAKKKTRGIVFVSEEMPEALSVSFPQVCERISHACAESACRVTFPYDLSAQARHAGRSWNGRRSAHAAHSTRVTASSKVRYFEGRRRRFCDCPDERGDAQHAQYKHRNVETHPDFDGRAGRALVVSTRSRPLADFAYETAYREGSAPGECA